MANIQQNMLAAAAAIFDLVGDLYETGNFQQNNIESLFDAGAYGGLSVLQDIAHQIVTRFTQDDGYSVEFHTVISNFLSDADISSIVEDDTEREKLSALSLALAHSLQEINRVSQESTSATGNNGENQTTSSIQERSFSHSQDQFKCAITQV